MLGLDVAVAKTTGTLYVAEGEEIRFADTGQSRLLSQVGLGLGTVQPIAELTAELATESGGTIVLLLAVAAIVDVPKSCEDATSVLTADDVAGMDKRVLEGPEGSELCELRIDEGIEVMLVDVA